MPQIQKPGEEGLMHWLTNTIICKFTKQQIIINQKCGRTPNVMATLPNISGALCSTPQFGWRPLLDCRAVTLPKTWNPLKLPGVPQTNERISDTRGPKFTILQGHVEEVLLLNKFFSDCWYVL